LVHLHKREKKKKKQELGAKEAKGTVKYVPRKKKNVSISKIKSANFGPGV